METKLKSRRDFPSAPRRVVSAPTTLRNHIQSTTSAKELVETLYSHPDVKIVSFVAVEKGRPREPVDTSEDMANDEPGTLPWTSNLERTIAVGPLRMYRAPGSVAFISCGTALQPILPKSQCWCIDELDSKFVLQIRRPNYWRIELPISDSVGQDKAQVFKKVLGEVLQFEKTQCPFKRSFTVELPDQPQRKHWTPIVQSLPSACSIPSLPFLYNDLRSPALISQAAGSSASNSSLVVKRSRGSHARDLVTEPLELTQSGTEADETQIPLCTETSMDIAPVRYIEFGNLGQTHDANGESGILNVDHSSEADECLSTSPGSIDSFHSVQSFRSYVGAKPPSSTARSSDLDTWLAYATTTAPEERRRSLQYETTATLPESRHATLGIDRHSRASALESVAVETLRGRFGALQIHTAIDNGDTSRHQLPSALSVADREISLSSAGPPRDYYDNIRAMRMTPIALVAKTCELLLGPPSYLINIMLNVAAKICAGQWTGHVYGLGENGESIPVQWYYSDEESSGWKSDSGNDEEEQQAEMDLSVHASQSEPDEEDVWLDPG